MNAFSSFLLGLVQGVAEFLPISSSGHLAIAQNLLHIDAEVPEFFDVLLHLGTLVAVCIAFWDTIWGMIVEFFRKCLSFRQENSWDATKVLVISVPRSSMISRSQL